MSRKKQRAFLKLYEPVHDQFERFCRARVYGEGDHRDIMHETLIVAYERFETLQSEKAFFSFLVGICIRLLANNNKKKKPTTGLEERFWSSKQSTGENPEQAAEVYLLHKALAVLPNEQRECMILFEISGFPIKDIARMQNTTESNVKQRLRRGRAKLTELLTFESAHKMGEVQS